MVKIEMLISIKFQNFNFKNLQGNIYIKNGINIFKNIEFYNKILILTIFDKFQISRNCHLKGLLQRIQVTF